jgi:multiple sugar transport system permease protein
VARVVTTSRSIRLRRKHRPPSAGSLKAAERRAGILFVLPLALITGALLFFPLAQAAYYSLTRWNGITATWVGLGNYSQMLNDPVLSRVVLNNAMLLLAIPFAIFIPMLVAFLLHTHVLGWRAFRSVYFLPTAISWVVIGMVSVRFFAQRGILNDLLATLGIPLTTNFLASERGAMVAISLTFIWSTFGTNTIIFITGMATLDRDVYEAARVDGASSGQVFRHITIPLLMRFIQFAFILTLITGYTALFSLIFVMTSGGPGYGTTTLEFLIYQKAFAQGVFGYAAAMGIVLFVIVFGISVGQRRLLRSRED